MLILLVICACIFVAAMIGEMILAYADNHAFLSEIRDMATESEANDCVTESEANDCVTESENAGILTLVNKTHTIPSDWEVDLVQLINGQSIDRRAYDSLQAMMDDARAEGLDPLICSSYRTTEKQTQLYNNKIERLVKEGYSQEEAETHAADIVSRPGTSEHQLGLAVDICSEAMQELEVWQEDTDVQQWLMANCYRYGFILRYPEDKTDITGVTYEPWHYRYVGVEAATVMYEENLCLEEYLEKYGNS